MRIRLKTNAAGDMHVQCLRDPKHKRDISPPAVPLLVCSRKLEEMTTCPKPAYAAGHGRISERTNFTKYGRVLMREAGAVLDERNRAACVFLTGTLPGSTPEAFQAIAAWSGWVVRTVQRWITHYAAHGQFFGVWEYQRRGALHLHLCVQCPSVRDAQELKSRWKARWIKVLDAVAKRSGVDVYRKNEHHTWQCEKWVTKTDAQTVERSVGAYLSKYLSKGSQKMRKRCYYPPSAWWFASRSLCLEIYKRRQKHEVCDLSLLDALQLFERLGGILVAQERSALGYICPYDSLVKGVVALLKPVEASMLFRQTQAVLRTLTKCFEPIDPLTPLTPELIRRMFGGVKISLDSC